MSPLTENEAVPREWDGSLEPVDYASVALVVGRRRGKDVEAGQVSLGAGVADELRGIAREVAEGLQQMRQQAWTAETAWERDELRRIQLSQLDDDNAVLRALSAREFQDLPLDALRDQSLLFYAIVVGSQPATGAADERRIFLRKTNPRLGAERKVVTILTGDELTRITQPLFTFDRKVDMVLVPGEGVLALAEFPFDMLFRDTPELLAKTPALARRLASHLPMAPGSEDVLVTAATKYARVRRRVLASAERGHLVDVTAAKLRSEFKRQQLDPGDFLRNGRLMLTEENILEAVRVLNEDLLTGGLSGQRFEIERKRSL